MENVYCHYHHHHHHDRDHRYHYYLIYLYIFIFFCDLFVVVLSQFAIVANVSRYKGTPYPLSSAQLNNQTQQFCCCCCCFGFYYVFNLTQSSQFVIKLSHSLTTGLIVFRHVRIYLNQPAHSGHPAFYRSRHSTWKVLCTLERLHVTERILESEKILLGYSGLLGFGIGSTAQEPLRNPTNFWNPESKFRWQRLESIDVTSKELYWIQTFTGSYFS